MVPLQIHGLTLKRERLFFHRSSPKARHSKERTDEPVSPYPGRDEEFLFVAQPLLLIPLFSFLSSRPEKPHFLRVHSGEIVA